MQLDYVEDGGNRGILPQKEGLAGCRDFLSALWSFGWLEETAVGEKRYLRAADLEAIQEFAKAILQEFTQKENFANRILRAVQEKSTHDLAVLLRGYAARDVRVLLQLSLLSGLGSPYRVYFRFRSRMRRLILMAVTPGEGTDYILDIGFMDAKETGTYLKLRRQRESEALYEEIRADSRTKALSLILFTKPEDCDRIQKTEQEQER